MRSRVPTTTTAAQARSEDPTYSSARPCTWPASHWRTSLPRSLASASALNSPSPRRGSAGAPDCTAPAAATAAVPAQLVRPTQLARRYSPILVTSSPLAPHADLLSLSPSPALGRSLQRLSLQTSASASGRSSAVAHKKQQLQL
ncbi:hypothetical protein K437DRAFT_271362 [Tilletiaria anomala UBC 951]|uniref:Uncharacterized protein n=1 Tax=Tilletiaria anomala (strain ATCC 24038 / CBS 436.72 / UBC 951) TaxID=1037660 RepID=A0A066V8S4_TILAU|nr:uncharacterized protein K437DRAFT_271362 [Tilletiaria anomala UBC 951]KDN35154.1 hypothetical protein K437DRAFT_271362 [Tilletiaria anomala UBC 951]